jgi:hypothetical protein
MQVGKKVAKSEKGQGRAQKIGKKANNGGLWVGS